METVIFYYFTEYEIQLHIKNKTRFLMLKVSCLIHQRVVLQHLFTHCFKQCMALNKEEYDKSFIVLMHFSFSNFEISIS